MTHRTFTLIGVVLVACFALFVFSAAAANAAPCQEDERCWTWSTMGNMERGVYLKGKRAIRVVDPCDFAHADFRDRIDWKRTKRLKGDWLARRHGCDPTLFPPDHAHPW